MAHFYNCSDSNLPTFVAEVQTPAQARKAGGHYYPSVTTCLGIVKDDFLDSIYKPRMMTELARKFPELQWRDIESLTYGTRKHPSSGQEISSAEFGTAVHKTIEEMVNSEVIGIDPPRRADCYDSWAEPFIDWIESNRVKPVSCEYIISNARIKIAGSVDFIGHDSDGKLFLADYKCRGNTNGKAKTYAKDCEQLAIESWMLMKKHKLDYLPSCRSVIIDCDTKEHIHREWTQDELQWGIQNAKDCAKLYWNKRLKPVVK